MQVGREIFLLGPEKIDEKGEGSWEGEIGEVRPLMCWENKLAACRTRAGGFLEVREAGVYWSREFQEAERATRD